MRRILMISLFVGCGYCLCLAEGPNQQATVQPGAQAAVTTENTSAQPVKSEKEIKKEKKAQQKALEEAKKKEQQAADEAKKQEELKKKEEALKEKERVATEEKAAKEKEKELRKREKKLSESNGGFFSSLFKANGYRWISSAISGFCIGYDKDKNMSAVGYVLMIPTIFYPDEDGNERSLTTILLWGGSFAAGKAVAKEDEERKRRSQEDSRHHEYDDNQGGGGNLPSSAPRRTLARAPNHKTEPSKARIDPEIFNGKFQINVSWKF